MQKQADRAKSFLTADGFDDSVDRLVSTYELVRRRRRDEIKAEYRAGLFAGGETLDVDWLEWFAN